MPKKKRAKPGPKPGTKNKPASEALGNSVFVRLNQADYAALTQAADKLDWSRSLFLREAIREKARAVLDS